MEYFREIVLDGIGVLVVLVGVTVATVRFIGGASTRQRSYRTYREDLGRAILLGLEFLVKPATSSAPSSSRRPSSTSSRSV